MSLKADARAKFLAAMFKAYYETNFERNYYLNDIKKREFGFLYWNNNKFLRHLGFWDVESLKEHIKNDVPQHIYSSAARYEVPDAQQMKLKSYQDCDLIFDLDVDHIPTPCKIDHDQWVCKQCGKTGRGSAPKVCPVESCNSISFRELAWECQKCMETAKAEITTIVEDFLSPDFGLDVQNDLFIVFSGRRGYHIHIEKEAVRSLDSNARREIVDYLTGKGLVPSFHGLNPNAQKKPATNDGGWRGRIAKLVVKLLKESSIEELQKILPRRGDILQIKSDLVFQLESDGPPWTYPNIGEKTWQKLLQVAIAKYAGKIDEPVTIDIHRLIRLPGSLHGKTGFLVKKLEFHDLELFDPFSQAQVFSGEKEVFVKTTPKFQMQNEVFGPFKDERVELPLSAAVYLLSKNLATL
ncbi:MAG: hypothetical protein EU536_01890 [Promethearchaeota archaeon]|nr:MAG: hypothetical protein EU536_01890 [Candidatus Lokiarchaeota archaeon]